MILLGYKIKSYWLGKDDSNHSTNQLKIIKQ